MPTTQEQLHTEVDRQLFPEHPAAERRKFAVGVGLPAVTA